MNEEKKIVIVEDDDRLIKFQDIVIRNDTVDREEVAQVKDEIARLEQEVERLEQEKSSINEKLVDLKAKVLYADRVIELANAEKLARQETVEQVSEVVEDVPATETVVEEV